MDLEKVIAAHFSQYSDSQDSMLKRKRSGSESGSGSVSPEPEAQHREEKVEEEPQSMRAIRAEAKLVNGHKLIARAFKTARGFERQKLGRRRKTALAASNAKDVERIDAETAALKTLDLSVAAANYLNKSLLKFKAVAEHPELPRKLTKQPELPKDAPTANVLARLCNSNPTKEALGPILVEIQKALGINDVKEIGKGKRVRAKDREQPTKRQKVTAQDSDDEVEGSGASEEEAARAKGRSRQQQIDEDISEHESDDYSAFDARIAGSESESEDDFAGFSDDDGAVEKGRPRQRNRDMSITPSPSPSPSPSPEPERAARKSVKQLKKPNKSAFVPSLTMGGYWSGSDSEPEDLDDVAPKKNRRGQRARQALAEKKYGSKAKHLANQDSAKNINQGWDSKRGATEGAGFRGRGRGGSRGGRGGSFGGGRGGSFGQAGRGDASAGKPGTPYRAHQPEKKKHRDDHGALHPSWEAAKKAKEAKMATAPFQGKKITFD